MPRAIFIVFLFIQTTCFGQALDSFRTDLKQGYKVAFDSLSSIMDASSDPAVRSDTVQIRDPNNPINVLGIFTTQYFKYAGSSLAKVQTRKYNRGISTYYFRDSFLFKVSIINAGEKPRTYYYPEEVHKESSRLHRKIALLYPETQEYWGYFESGRSFLEDLRLE